MNTHTIKHLQIGDRVRLLEDAGVNEGGTVTEVLPGDYARVRWDDAAIQTTHRTYALKVANDCADVTQLLKSLSDLSRAIDGE